jgi:Arc/MetJ-type ribon-helix-helix transcriptional regulator
MKLTLSSKTQRQIGAIIESGRYETADELVLAGLAALEQQGQFGDFAASELNELLAAGERSIVEEGTTDADEVFSQIRKQVDLNCRETLPVLEYPNGRQKPSQ